MSDLHVEVAAHHEAPEIVDHRQRLGIWLFIGGDVVTTGALIFTYLYLRAVNTNGSWMSVVGLPANGRSASTLQGILDDGGSRIKFDSVALRRAARPLLRFRSWPALG